MEYISQTESDVDNFTIVFQEYRKILRMEKSRRRLERQIKQSYDTATLKEDLKKTRRQKKFASKPYAKKAE